MGCVASGGGGQLPAECQNIEVMVDNHGPVDLTQTADAARRLVKKAYLYTNNHFSAKSVANAAMIKKQLGEPVDGNYPPEFVAQYPELAGVVRVKRDDYSLT